MVFDRILVYLQYPYEDVRHRNYALGISDIIKASELMFFASGSGAFVVFDRQFFGY